MNHPTHWSTASYSFATFTYSTSPDLTEKVQTIPFIAEREVRAHHSHPASYLDPTLQSDCWPSSEVLPDLARKGVESQS